MKIEKEAGEILHYITDDGKRFSTPESAKHHEEQLEAINKIQSIPSFKSILVFPDLSSATWYMPRSANDVHDLITAFDVQLHYGDLEAMTLIAFIRYPVPMLLSMRYIYENFIRVTDDVRTGFYNRNQKIARRFEGDFLNDSCGVLTYQEYLEDRLSAEIAKNKGKTNGE